jgi:hypothetical protein
VQNGSGKRIVGTNSEAPDQQTSGILFGDRFPQQEETAQKFMNAYLQGVRFYLDAIDDDGRLQGAKGDEVADVLANNTTIKDAEFFKDVPLHGADPNGKSNRESLEADLAFWKERGYVKGDVSVDEALDEKLIDAAAKELGPYEPASGG